MLGVPRMSDLPLTFGIWSKPEYVKVDFDDGRAGRRRWLRISIAFCSNVESLT